ncbi:hypothetical protein QT972_00355 [Microcoleus sp. herbarium7]|uniref:hypothetical protein n=1 Tax=Microcoleus sp. herbarium7 TaxID=3055435 RepID=UPI002FD11982
MKLPPIKWRKLLKETLRYALAAASFGGVVASRVLFGNASAIAEAGGFFLGLVYLQVSPRFFESWKNLNQSIKTLEEQVAGVEELISIRQAELFSIEETLGAQEELSRQRIDALLSAERMVLSEREAEVTNREQIVSEDEDELRIELENLKTQKLAEVSYFADRQQIEFDQHCEQQNAELAERKRVLTENHANSIAQLEALQEEKAQEIQEYYDAEKAQFEEICNLREAEFEKFKLDFLQNHHEKVERFKGRIEQLESELQNALMTIEQLQETFPDDIEQSTIIARAIRDVLRSQGIASSYKGAYSHEDGRIFVRLRVDYSEAKVRPYLGLVQQRLGVSTKIALTITHGAMQFVVTPDAWAAISGRVEERTASVGIGDAVDRGSSVATVQYVTTKEVDVLSEPLESFQNFLQTMNEPLNAIALKGDISTTERNWILKLWLVDKMQNQRHICNRVYKARPGDNQKWVKARERLHKVFDAYNIQYQVRSKSEVEV